MLEKRTIAFSPPDLSEAEVAEVGAALRSGWITTGPRTKQFEREIAAFVGVDRAVCLNSATAALELTLRVLGIGPGDEVIAPAYTYTASCSVIEHVGATIVMVDSQADSVEMDYEQMEEKISERTKAIIPVDIAGILCDYANIYERLERKKALYRPATELQRRFDRIPVIADAAHSFGARQMYRGHWRNAGQLADFTAFSFHAVKNLTTAEGGALVWNPELALDDDALYQEYQLLSLHGQSKDALAKTQLGAWEYDVVYPAYKCNMTDILAAVGLRQLERYPQLLERRRAMIDRYDAGCRALGLTIPKHYNDRQESSGHLYLLRIPGYRVEPRNRLISALAERGVASNVHYKPLPMMTAYQRLGFHIEDYPQAYHLYENEVTLPLHTKLTDEDIDYVIAQLKDLL